MERMKRIVVPGYPHHVVQKGVRSMDIFFKEQGRVEYLRLLREQSDCFGISFLTYCLMMTHVHFLVVLRKNSKVSPDFPRVINLSCFHRIRVLFWIAMYKSSTFFLAQGVFRRNLRLDFTEGLHLKQRILMRLPSLSQL